MAVSFNWNLLLKWSNSFNVPKGWVADSNKFLYKMEKHISKVGVGEQDWKNCEIAIK